MASKSNRKSPYPRRFTFASGPGWIANQLKFSKGSVYYGCFLEPLEERKRFTPTPEEWLQFWDEIEAAGVWKWERYYDNHDILDGTQWSLTMARGSQTMFSEGSNAYPGGTGMRYSDSSSYGRFMQAIRKLTGDQHLFK